MGPDNQIKIYKQYNIVFLHPFLLLAHKLETLVMPCGLVKSWHCLYFSLSQSLFSRSKSLTTDSISWTWRNLCGFWTSEHLVLKHLSFLVFTSLLWILNLALISVANLCNDLHSFYKESSRWHYCCYKTICLWHYKTYQ